MEDLIREGKILHWGISETTEEYLRKAHEVCPVAAVQNRYSMMARKHEALFPVLEELGIGFVAFSPLANGLLTECYRGTPRHTFAGRSCLDDEQAPVDCPDSRHQTSLAAEGKRRRCGYPSGQRRIMEHRHGTRLDGNERGLRWLADKAVTRALVTEIEVM